MSDYQWNASPPRNWTWEEHREGFMAVFVKARGGSNSCDCGEWVFNLLSSLPSYTQVTPTEGVIAKMRIYRNDAVIPKSAVFHPTKCAITIVGEIPTMEGENNHLLTDNHRHD